MIDTLVTEPKSLKITCMGRPNRLLKITGPIKRVQLENSCTGHADSFILPAYFEGHSQINNNMQPNIDLINSSLNASTFQIWQNLNASNPVARKLTLTKLDPMKRYNVSNVNSALRAYHPNLPEDNEWGLTDWSLYILLPAVLGIITFSIMIVIFVQCKLYQNCYKVYQKNTQNDKPAKGPFELVEFEPMVNCSGSVMSKIPKCDRMSVHVDSL